MIKKQFDKINNEEVKLLSSQIFDEGGGRTLDRLLTNGKILWSNTGNIYNGTNDFSAPLNSADFNCYEIIFLGEAREPTWRCLRSTGVLPVHQSFLRGILTTTMIDISGTTPKAQTFTRWYDLSSDKTNIQFGVGFLNDGTSVKNERPYAAVPLYIIGYNNSVYDNI